MEVSADTDQTFDCRINF